MRRPKIKTTVQILDENIPFDIRWVRVSDILELFKRNKVTKKHIIELLEKDGGA